MTCNNFKPMIIFGTRPEAIKMCPLIQEMRTQKIDVRVCVSGQHREMLWQVLDIFDIDVDYNLDIMRDNQYLTDIVSSILNRLKEIYNDEKPSLVIVHGDTTTAYAAALAAFYCEIPIGHVEAGLRTYDLHAPFPEEFNRQSIDLMSEWLFAPTESARNNLVKEGKPHENIYVTGNTVIDALKTTVINNFTDENIRWIGKSRMILLTAHRRENIGKPMTEIFEAVRDITENFPDVKVIFPVHKNPKVRMIAGEILGNSKSIRLIEPLRVRDFHNYMAKSYLILTDSGGIQEEAPTLGVPVLVLRNKTERPEAVQAGTSLLVGTTRESVYGALSRLLKDRDEYECMHNAVNPYGDGNASKRIVKALVSQHYV